MQKVLLVCYVTPKIGLGHLSRLLALAHTLKKDKKVIPNFLIFGDLVKKNELYNFKVNYFSVNNSINSIIEKLVKTEKFNLIIFDIHQSHIDDNLNKLIINLKKKRIILISIDSLIEYCQILDLIWIPSFNFKIEKYKNCQSLLMSGWDSYLIHKRLNHNKWRPGSKILVLTGGSDISNLAKILPTQLDKILDKQSEIHWVKGPFSKGPQLPDKLRLNWIIHESPEYLDKLIVQSNYVITVFGISFFEALQYGIPTVVFSPYGKKDDEELNALLREEVAVVALNKDSAIRELSILMNDNEKSIKLSLNALKKMSTNGTQKLSKKIYTLINN